MNCGGQCRSCGTVDRAEVRRMVLPFLPDVRELEREPAGSRIPNEPSRPPQPVLTPARSDAVPSHVPSDPPPPPPSRREVRHEAASPHRREVREDHHRSPTMTVKRLRTLFQAVRRRAQIAVRQAIDLIVIRQAMI